MADQPDGPGPGAIRAALRLLDLVPVDRLGERLMSVSAMSIPGSGVRIIWLSPCIFIADIFGEDDVRLGYCTATAGDLRRMPFAFGIDLIPDVAQCVIDSMYVANSVCDQFEASKG